jgi:hypothetical protein
MVKTTHIAGAPAWAQADWVTAAEEIEPEWLNSLLRQHRKAVAAYAERVGAEHAACDELSELESRHREAVRQELAAGRPAPPAPDPAVFEARLSIAREDVSRAETAVARVAVQVLGSLRKRRAEVGPKSALGQALRESLERGPGGASVASRIAKLRAELAQLEAAEGGPIVDVSTPAHARLERANREETRHAA